MLKKMSNCRIPKEWCVSIAYTLFKEAEGIGLILEAVFVSLPLCPGNPRELVYSLVAIVKSLVFDIFLSICSSIDINALGEG
jgi:hypothetical protein